ncbi:hypothetical protein PTSG_10712 [Salpingoeca rosetta]|uniref:SH2 domain-containing protein n=1 Tax=Salpingoeca rosetta (strain ATCC 50818 / BSB-021) TaxID=946362 RepID=F2UQ60_SALR5|nr:uncharacterized protein PTSG_10712 [Salpingoeca rosetta]EGD79728.1 hypothetical protein PTSG_10712 [Salpingoeca rosetta]|eukprot:XP_004988677.1 hypothetical protein PTSG_10712 [Salpingoeca rosetta]
MATKQEKFALFRAQTQQYLDQHDAVRVKGVLSTFLKDKALESMVDGLLQILDTDEKRRMLPTIQSLIPSKYHDDFDQLVATGMTKQQPQALDDADDTPAAPSASSGLSDEEVARRILDNPSLVEGELDDEDGDGDDDDAEERAHGKSRFVRRTAATVDADECPVDLGQEDGEMSMFDLMITMAEADLKLDSVVDQEQEEDEEEQPRRRMSVNDMKRQQMKQSLRLTQRGFRSGSFAMRNPRTTSTSSTGSDTRAVPDEVRQVAFRAKSTLPDYFCLANTRAEAAAYLRMAGTTPGLFLVREKDMRPGGSFKRKPGQRLPTKAWAVSFVNGGGEVCNILIERMSKRGALRIGGQDVPDCSTVHDVLLKMVRSQQYPLKATPFQCHRWYHGAISREEAEARLLSVPVDGRFLVRKSTREEDIFIISLTFGGRCYHNKIAYVDGAWIASAAPLLKHRSLVDLIAHHTDAPNGMQTSLAKPCARPTPWTLEGDADAEA